MIVTEDQT